jgi:hypothetical protein
MATKPNLPGDKAPAYKGEMTGDGGSEKFAKPFEAVDQGVTGLAGTQDDIGEKSGFTGDTAGYIVKKGMAYGEAAKLNIMPPGMDINDQPYRDIRDMPMKTYSGGVSFPGDGWPNPKDLAEGYASKGSVE